MGNSNHKKQSDIFLATEGDAWFLRNRDDLESFKSIDFDVDFISNSLAPFRESITNILEIGCASGRKVASLAKYFDARGFGLDPSQLAINEAKESNRGNISQLNFDVGTATDLPYLDEMFDLVFFGFCLYSSLYYL